MKPSLSYPSRHDVDLALLEIQEAEKERTRKALEYVNAHRQPVVITGKSLLWFMTKLLFWSAVVAAFVILWLAQ